MKPFPTPVRPLLFILAMILSVRLPAESGFLDLSFAGQGYRVEPSGGAGFPRATALLVQPDGKLVLAGHEYDYSRNIDRMFLLRVKADGTPDLSFGMSGKVVTTHQMRESLILGAALQSDGKIVVVGGNRDRQNNGYFHSLIARYLPNGNLDATFGNDGTGMIVTNYSNILSGHIDPAFNDHDWSSTVAIKDGKIVVVGTFTNRFRKYQPIVQRYLPNGTPDNTFGIPGFVALNAPYEAQGLSLVIQPTDGKIVIMAAGSTPLLYRLNSNGTNDFGYGTAGIVTLNGFLGVNAIVLSALQVVVAGQYRRCGTCTLGVGARRYDIAGKPIRDYGPAFHGGQLGAAGVVVQTDGKVVVASNAEGAVSVVRFLPGGLEDSYGTFPLGASLDFSSRAQCLALQPDGKIVVGERFRRGF